MLSSWFIRLVPFDGESRSKGSIGIPSRIQATNAHARRHKAATGRPHTLPAMAFTAQPVRPAVAQRATLSSRAACSSGAAPLRTARCQARAATARFVVASAESAWPAVLFFFFTVCCVPSDISWIAINMDRMRFRFQVLFPSACRYENAVMLCVGTAVMDTPGGVRRHALSMPAPLPAGAGDADAELEKRLQSFKGTKNWTEAKRAEGRLPDATAASGAYRAVASAASRLLCAPPHDMLGQCTPRATGVGGGRACSCCVAHRLQGGSCGGLGRGDRFHGGPACYGRPSC